MPLSTLAPSCKPSGSGTRAPCVRIFGPKFFCAEIVADAITDADGSCYMIDGLPNGHSSNSIGAHAVPLPPWPYVIEAHQNSSMGLSAFKEQHVHQSLFASRMVPRRLKDTI